MAWEYKTVWLPRAEPDESWDDQGKRWSEQLTALGAEGWEIAYFLPPWVALKRRVET
jgi:hypothetical protein